MSKKKTGRLNKVEKFYIENNPDKSVEDLAKDLNRSEAVINKYVNEKGGSGHLDSVQDEKSTVGELMGHKENRGVTIMTPAASELADETRSSRGKYPAVNEQGSSRYDNAIHIIKQDK